MTKFIQSIETNYNGDVTGVTYNHEVLTPVIKSLHRNNTFFPAIKNIIVNGPFTKMFFVDGTSVSVKRSDADPANVDAAIAFCVFKRLFGKPDENGDIQGDGFSSYLRKTVAGRVFDQAAHEKKVAEERQKKQLKKKSECKGKCKDSCNKDGDCKCGKKDKKTNANVKKSFPNRDSRGHFAKKA